MLNPGRPPRPAFVVTSDERALARVVEQAILTDGRDEQVGEAVVVEIAGGHAHPVHLDGEAGSRGHVGKSAGAVVPVQARVRR